MEEDIAINIGDRICGELEDKNRVLSEYARDREESGDKEGVIQVRIHQLALCKVLVTVHNRNNFILVQAHTNLGECYLNYEYYEQALEHLTVALKLNGTLFSTFEETKQYHTHILTLLGRCYLEAGGIEDAIGLLEKAIKMNHAIVGEDHLSNCTIFQAMSKAYVKKKDYTKALDSLTSVWELQEQHFGMKHESIAEVYCEMANVYYKQKDLANAIDVQKRALNLYLELDQQTDIAADVALALSQWEQENNNYPDALDALRQAEHIYEFNNGQIDKKTAKVKRNVCMLLLKAGEYEDALEECKELEQVDKALYGDKSIQYAKNLKVIGTIFMILNKYHRAKESYERALAIFSRHRNAAKSIREIRQKLKSIEPILAENPNDSDDTEQDDVPHPPEKPDVELLADPFEKSPKDEDASDNSDFEREENSV